MIKDDYREETNLDVYDNIERGAYCNDYVHWLETKLQLMQTSVVGQSEQFTPGEIVHQLNQEETIDDAKMYYQQKIKV